MMAGYLSGSTINVTDINKPQRYTGAYVTDELFKMRRRAIANEPLVNRFHPELGKFFPLG